MTPPKPPSGLWDFLINRVGKEGIFAILFCATLGIILYGGWQLAEFAKAQGADYLSHQKTVMSSLADANAKNAGATEQVAQAVTQLVGFHDSVAIQHETMIKGIDFMVGHIGDDENRDSEAAAKLDQLIALMAEANKLMMNVPTQRQEELSLLREIEVGIQQLRDDLTKRADSPSDAGEGTP